MNRAVVLALILIAAAGCGIKTVKFPADAFIANYAALRLQVQDETYAARQRCAKDRTKLSEAVQEKCRQLDQKMTDWTRRDAAVLQAILNGGTVDKETVDTALGYIPDILKLAAAIGGAAAL